MLWAFSFGLIKTRLAGIDPFAVAALRLALSLIAFAPWLRPRGAPPRLLARCLLWGGVQFGLMYVCYIAAFADLPAWLVALLTSFTPLYVVLIEDVRARRAAPRHAAAALLAVAGALAVVGVGAGGAAWRGVLLVQVSNLCFAAGSLAYRGLAGARGGPRAAGLEATLTAWMYLGAVLLTAPLAAVAADRARLAITPDAWLALLYLGLIPTAVGFHLWNKGAARAAPGALAAANNLKVPLGVLAAWLVFGERAEPWRAAAGLALVIAALVVAARDGRAAGRAPASTPS